MAAVGSFIIVFNVGVVFYYTPTFTYSPGVFTDSAANDHDHQHNNKNKIRRSQRHQQTYNDTLHELDMLSGGYSSKYIKCPPPLIPFHNQIVRANQTHNSTSSEYDMKIPKILHVSMKSRCLPRDLARSMDKWKQTLPNYSIFFHDDEAVAKLIDQEWPGFPDLRRAMRCVLYKGAMRIDVWRVLVLYKYGGVYTDIDNWPLDAFKESTIRNDLSAFFFRDGRDRPSQWFMALESHHPMMHLAMTQIVSNIMDMKSMRRPRIVEVTGPVAVKVAYHNFLAPTCCNESTALELVFANDIVMTGILGKQLIKISRDNFLFPKYQYNELVPYNATLNVTRQERIEMDSGTRHWEKISYKGSNLLPVDIIHVKDTLPLLIKESSKKLIL